MIDYSYMLSETWQKMDSTSRFVYTVLRTMSITSATLFGGDRMIRIKQETIGKITGHTSATVCRCCQKLRLLKAISYKKRKGLPSIFSVFDLL